jgi:hypothetical protein
VDKDKQTQLHDEIQKLVQEAWLKNNSRVPRAGDEVEFGGNRYAYAGEGTGWWLVHEGTETVRP